MPELRKWQFHREVRAGIDIVVFEDGGCVPATGVESTLFDIESDLRTRIEELEAENSRLRGENGKVKQKLNAIIMEVAHKFEGESRYETALRFVRERQNIKYEASKALTATGEEGERDASN